MNFASKLVNFDVDDQSDDEIEVQPRRRLNYSDCEIDSDDDWDSGSDDDIPLGLVAHDAPAAAAAPPPAGAAAAPAARCMPPMPPIARKPRKIKVRKLNTNVVELALGTTLSAESSGSIVTGDPVVCGGCSSIFSATSKLIVDEKKEKADTAEDDDDLVTGTWNCEFCSKANEVAIDAEEMPKGETLDYIVDESLRGSAGNGLDLEFGTKLTIFVVDVSGSMCITSEVKGKQKLKGFEKLQKQQQDWNPENEDQYLPGQARDVSYISRLQCVQAAVDYQIEEMSKKTPDASVGLIAFNNEVTLIGDGTGAPVTLAGDRLYDYDQVLAAGKEFPVSSTVADSADTLRSKVFSLMENGATALGPALLAAVGVASRVPGSTVVVCTDGMANTGIGSLEVKEEQLEHVEGFYNRVGALAEEAGVVVNLVSIKGSDCRMEYLSAVSEATGGKVTMVDPLNLVKEFSSLLADPVVASHVSVTFHLHKGLHCIGNEQEDSSSQVLTRKIGNVTRDTVDTFEFGITKEAREDKTITSLPFQVQIRFRRQSDGLELMRVITQEKQVTHDREAAKDAVDIAVLGTHAAQRSATMAMEGEYSSARGYAFKAKEFIKELSMKKQSDKAGYTNFKRSMVTMEETLSKAQRSEQADGLCLSDSEDEEQDVSSKVARKKMKKLQSRKKKRNDSTATNLYAIKHSNARTLFANEDPDLV